MPIDRPPSILRRLGAVAAMGLTVATALLAATGTAAAAPPARVSNADIAPVCPAPSPTGFCTELAGAGTAAVVDDRRADGGGGYLRLTTRATTDHATVFAQRFGGMRLADINDLAFATFIERSAMGNDQAAPSINIPIRPNKAGAGPFTTLVWEPTYSGARVTSNRWQQWTPSTAGGGWWATGAITATGTPNTYGFPSYTATFAQVKAALPNAVVYAVGVNQGSGVAGLVAGVDQLRVNGTTYDFENAAPTADLGVGITAPPTVPGSTVTATVTVTNAGRSPARDVSTALVVSGGGRVVRAPGGVTFGQITAFRTPVLGVGASATYVVTLAVDKAPRWPLTLFAGTHSAVQDPKPANNSARATVPVWAPRPLPVAQPGPGQLPGPYPGPQPGPRPGPQAGRRSPARRQAGSPARSPAPGPARRPQAPPPHRPPPAARTRPRTGRRTAARIRARPAPHAPAPGPAPGAAPQPAPQPASAPAPAARSPRRSPAGSGSPARRRAGTGAPARARTGPSSHPHRCHNLRAPAWRRRLQRAPASHPGAATAPPHPGAASRPAAPAS